MREFVRTGRIVQVVMGVLAVCIGVFHGSTAFALSGSGAGTSGSPYQITTCAQLNTINLDLTAYYVLANDIDCTSASASAGWSPIGASGGGFTGTLDGQNHKITNLDLSGITDSTNFAGMFSTIKNTAVVKNVRIIDSKLNAGANSGMVAGGVYNTATLDNVYVWATVICHDQNCGGLVGSLHDSSVINNSGADVSVTGSSISVGGLVGWISGDGVIQESFANGYISGTLYVGGLVGAVNNGSDTATITNAYANATVEGSEYIGGLAGLGARVNITNAYAAGSVSGTDSVGGLVGLFYGHMAETFAANTIAGTGGAVGPVTGHFAGGTVGNRYFDTNITGFSDSPDGSSPITSSDYFRDNSTNPPFNQWNFTTIWRTNYGAYPSFAPKIDPYMLCEEPHSTDMSVTGVCDVAPLGWGTPTWQARWSVHGANDWHSITLNDIHKASATVTGLTPGTTYDVSFRYTNNFGTGAWGTMVVLTTGSAPSSTTDGGGRGATTVLQSIAATAARFFSEDNTFAASDEHIVVPTPSKETTSTASGNSDADPLQRTADAERNNATQGAYNWVVLFGIIAFIFLITLFIVRYVRRHHQ